MNPNRIIDAIKRADYIVKTLLAVREGEEVLLIADSETDIEMVQALAGVIETVGAEYTIALIPTKPLEASLRMPKFVEKGLEVVNVVIGMTKASGAACYSPLYRVLRRKTGLRMLSMVMRDMDNWTKGGATADYAAIFEKAKKLKAVWERGREIVVTSKKGTSLKAKIGPNPPFIEAGFATGFGEHAAFSDGEVSQGPIEGTAEGTVVIDGPSAYLGQLMSPVKLTIAKGKVIKVEGDERGVKRLTDILKHVKDADNFAEVGIGLNPNCLQNGNFEEEKKRLGNVHIAIGRNTGAYGGTVASMIHMDMVIYDATVQTDQDTLLFDGKLQI